MIRAVVLSATIAALLTLWMDKPKPPKKITQVDYCQVDLRVAVKDELGNWRFGWGSMFRPCSELDRYENV